jgi:hypothetical protein
MRAPTIIALAALAALPAAGHAATARIAPVQVGHSLLYADATLIAHAGDSCRMLIDTYIVAAGPGAPIFPVYRGRRGPISACDVTYEDGSALRRISAVLPRPTTGPGRYFLGIRVWSRPRAGGSAWSSHTFVRSFHLAY